MKPFLVTIWCCLPACHYMSLVWGVHTFVTLYDRWERSVIRLFIHRQLFQHFNVYNPLQSRISREWVFNKGIHTFHTDTVVVLFGWLALQILKFYQWLPSLPIIGLLPKIKVFGVMPALDLWSWMRALFWNPFYCWAQQVWWVVTAQARGRCSTLTSIKQKHPLFEVPEVSYQYLQYQ